jgi:hypothetical protein
MAQDTKRLTDGPWSSFPIQLGGGTVQKQTVRVMPSTAGYNTWVINAQGCPDFYGDTCSDTRGFLYNKNDSLTYLPQAIYDTQIEKNLGLDTSGYGGYETIELGWQGSNGPSLEHMPIFEIADDKYWLGIFGLNPLPTNFSGFNNPQPSFMQTLYDNNTIPSRSYGYTAGAKYRFNEVYGSLTLGGYDSNRFTPTNTTFDFYSDIARDLLVNLKSITSDKASSSDLLPDGQISIYLDSTVSTLWLPESACDAFEEAFNLTYDSDLGRYLVNDTVHGALTETNPSFIFTLVNGSGDEVDITLPYAAFDLTLSYPLAPNGTTSHYFPLQRAANNTQYTLGRAFFQEAYLIADYDRGNFTVAPCAWDSNNVATTAVESILSPNLTRKAGSDDDKSGGSAISGGAIAGIAVGIVALIAILGLTLWLLRRKKKANKRGAAHLTSSASNAEDAKSFDGTTTAHGEAKPFISTPMGGELAGDSNEIHELTAPHKAPPVEMDSPYKTDPNKVGYAEMDGGVGAVGFYGPGKGGAHEMHGSTPVFEMEGSAVNEMGPGRRSVDMREKEKR